MLIRRQKMRKSEDNSNESARKKWDIGGKVMRNMEGR